MKRKLTEVEKKKKREGNARLRAAMKERRDKLFDGDPVAHMHKMSDMQDALRQYYYLGSELWRAIRHHIIHAKDCVLVDLEATIISHRGTGPSIRVKDCTGYSDHYYFYMDVEIEYFCEGQENSYDPRTYTKIYLLQIPNELERKFTKKAFNAWIEEERIKRDESVEKEERAELARLKKKYEGQNKK
jgi:hypothetical protein